MNIRGNGTILFLVFLIVSTSIFNFSKFTLTKIKIKEINKKINSLETQTNEINTQIASLSKENKELKDNNKDSEIYIIWGRGKVEFLKTKFEKYKEDKAELIKAIKDLKEKENGPEEIKRNIDNLKKRIKEIKEEILANEEQFNSILPSKMINSIEMIKTIGEVTSYTSPQLILLYNSSRDGKTKKAFREKVQLFEPLLIVIRLENLKGKHLVAAFTHRDLYDFEMLLDISKADEKIQIFDLETKENYYAGKADVKVSQNTLFSFFSSGYNIVSVKENFEGSTFMPLNPPKITIEEVEIFQLKDYS